MHHFFVEPAQIAQDNITITGSDVNHIQHVLRMKVGEEVIIYDGDYHEYRCAISAFAPEEVLLEILERTEQKSELSSRLYLFQGLPKADKMDLIIQKAVELGACEIIPVQTKRTVVKLDEKKRASRAKRWQAIAKSAAGQSGRGIVPVVRPVMTLAEAFAYARELDARLIPYECEHDMCHTRQVLAGLHQGMSVGIFIGPEGGFDETEIEQAMAEQIVPITLGRRILRTETAGLCILSVLMFLLEDAEETVE